jgi:hypothetical protein
MQFMTASVEHFMNFVWKNQQMAPIFLIANSMTHLVGKFLFHTSRVVRDIWLKATTCSPCGDSFYNGASNFSNMISMDKHPKIVKRQRARVIEPKTDFVPTSESSFAQADESVESAEPAVLEQPIESVKPPMLTESWQAIDRKPSLYYPAVSQWLEELREIRQECEKDVWESCPYD